MMMTLHDIIIILTIITLQMMMSLTVNYNDIIIIYVIIIHDIIIIYVIIVYDIIICDIICDSMTSLTLNFLFFFFSCFSPQFMTSLTLTL